MDSARIFAPFAGGVQWLLDQLYPPRCAACHVPVSSQGNVCQGCFAKLHAISEPHCATCGIPFPLDVGADTQCAECLATPPQFHKARSVWVYNHISARMIKRLKLEDRPEQLSRFAAQLARVASPLMGADSVIVPVPMHWQKLLGRRYNASAWLAHALASHMGAPCETSWLLRKKRVRRQRGLGRSARLHNIRRAFSVPESAHGKIAGKTILLVDDVITTGATANACARALKDAGAARVNVVTLAHTVKEGSV